MLTPIIAITVIGVAIAGAPVIPGDGTVTGAVIIEGVTAAVAASISI